MRRKEHRGRVLICCLFELVIGVILVLVLSYLRICKLVEEMTIGRSKRKKERKKKDIFPYIQSKLKYCDRAMDAYWEDWGSSDPTSSSWDWSVDMYQRQMLQLASQRGVQRFEMFSNSPVWWMCINHNPGGADNGLFSPFLFLSLPILSLSLQIYSFLYFHFHSYKYKYILLFSFLFFADISF